MASRSRRPNGHTWFFVKAANGKRTTLRFGGIDNQSAEEAKRRLTILENCFHKQIEVDSVTIAWADSLPLDQYRKVVGTGLLQADNTAEQTNVRSIDSLIRHWRTTKNVKASTLKNYEQVFDVLRRYFGGDREVSSILPAEADKFHAWLLSSGRKKKKQTGVSRSTASRRCRTVRTIMEFAVRLKWIKENPFEHVKSQGEFNEERNYYVTPRLVDYLIDNCPDPEFAAMIALCRYASFRGHSEFSNFGWSDYDFEESSVIITSPKTAGYRGKHRRMVPKCEKAIAALDKLWDVADQGVEAVFPTHGHKQSSPLSEALERLCRKCNVVLWPKPWINMRASCETDWQAEGYSIFETAAWMGHSPEVALRHYNRVAKDHVADLPASNAKQIRRSTPSETEARPEAS